MSQTTGNDPRELQRILDYNQQVRKNLRVSSIGSIIFGLIAIATGLGSAGDNPLNVILALIGIFLVAEGIWIGVAPSPVGMLVDGLGLLLLGGWNLMITLFNISAGDIGGGFWFLIAGYQIVGGVQSLNRYRRFSGESFRKPSQENVKQVDEMVNSLLKARPEKSGDVIEFKAAGKQWKGRLSGDTAIFMSPLGNEAVFTRRNEVQFVNQDKAPAGKSIKVSIQLGPKSYSGTILPESLRRYETWKNSPAVMTVIQKGTATCQNCRSENPLNAKYCTTCGSKLETGN